MRERGVDSGPLILDFSCPSSPSIKICVHQSPFFPSSLPPSPSFSSRQVFSFRFITIFTSLYYYAFCKADREGAYVRISVTVFSLITVGQWWGALMDICFPSIVNRILTYRMKVRGVTMGRDRALVTLSLPLPL
jgi:hypothetical protein